MVKKKIALEVNSKIRTLLQSNQINIQDGLTFLISVYYNLTPSFIPKDLENKVLALNIINKDYETNQIVWKVNLFEEQITGFEWITEFMDLFGKVNPDRRGVKIDVLKRMKKFFMNNPIYRKEDVINATKSYLKTLTDPMYCKKSHKFIYEIDGTSMLMDFVERELIMQKLNIDEDDNIIKIKKKDVW